MTHHLVTKRLQAGSITDKAFGCLTCHQNWVLAYREHEKVLSYCCMPKQRAVEPRAFKVQPLHSALPVTGSLNPESAAWWLPEILGPMLLPTCGGGSSAERHPGWSANFNKLRSICLQSTINPVYQGQRHTSRQVRT